MRIWSATPHPPRGQGVGLKHWVDTRAHGSWAMAGGQFVWEQGGLTRGWLALSNTQLNPRLLGYDIVLAGINVWLVRVVLCYRAHTVLAFLDLWEIHTASIIGYYHCIMYIWPLQNCKIWHLCSGWWSKKKRSKLYYRRKKIHFTKWCLLMTWITTWAPNKLSRVSVFFFTGHIIIVMGSEAAGHPIYKQWA